MLVEFKYRLEECPMWNYQELKILRLFQTNLLVGERDAGKSSALYMIFKVVKWLRGKYDPNLWGNWEFKLWTPNEQVIKYYVSTTEDFKIVEEKVWLNRDLIMDRKGKNARFFSKNIEIESVELPENKLITNLPELVKKYSFLQDILAWSRHSHKSVPEDLRYDFDYDIDFMYISCRELDTLMEGGSKELLKKTEEHFKKIGYPIIEIIKKNRNGVNSLIFVDRNEVFMNDDFEDSYTIEKEEEPEFYCHEGMFIAFYALAYLQYLIEKDEPALLLFDDLAIGMEDIYAQKFGDIVFDMIKGTKIQLITATPNILIQESTHTAHWKLMVNEEDLISTYDWVQNEDEIKRYKYLGDLPEGTDENEMS